ncbi:MAG TPA: DUF2779 domain-containing protein [Bacteroidales bacterium]|nr:DUF2779 domain-containing protein [Bacteroidales bacterium]
MSKTYLTKSRFKTGLECPNKVYFGNDTRYVNNRTDDPFLLALAQGGFQVEVLARLHYPEGRFIEAANYEYERAHDLSREALAEGEVVLFEAGFLIDGLFVRTDIMEKKGRRIRVIEVKSKSFDPDDDEEFLGKRGGLQSRWKPYLFDLAFQKYVVSLLYPSYTIEAWLMLADKNKVASVDGLNQMIRIPRRDKGDQRKDAGCAISSLAEIGGSVLTEINVSDIVSDIIRGKYEHPDGLKFRDAVGLLKDTRQGDTYPSWPVSMSSCRKCEFRASTEQLAAGSLSGFHFCWAKQKGWTEKEFAKPNAMEIWMYRGTHLLDEGRVLMEELVREDFGVAGTAEGLSAGERQWMQVEKIRSCDMSFYADRDGIAREMEKWAYPLHFIDFETSAVALPFTKGRRPYEQVAFQFSHHQYNADGSIEHRSEFIEATPGVFPNFAFVRALRLALCGDQGSIFRFAAHENTILNAILLQLRESEEADKNELIAFLHSITHNTGNSAERWRGERDMVDLRKLVLDFYYNPYSGGSNSIKELLPAVLQSSPFLKAKYTCPISEIGLSSKNFLPEHIWLKEAEGKVINPYLLLPPLFPGWSPEQLDELLSSLDEIANGGAALTAYATLQFTDMPVRERTDLIAGLLRYCELDTLAMVMIFEHLRYDVAKE